ncbi:hypothetical protein U1Q18_041558 [Sarracenia purpurea var. burkii]
MALGQLIVDQGEAKAKINKSRNVVEADSEGSEAGVLQSSKAATPMASVKEGSEADVDMSSPVSQKFEDDNESDVDDGSDSGGSDEDSGVSENNNEGEVGNHGTPLVQVSMAKRKTNAPDVFSSTEAKDVGENVEVQEEPGVGAINVVADPNGSVCCELDEMKYSEDEFGENGIAPAGILSREEKVKIFDVVSKNPEFSTKGQKVELVNRGGLEMLDFPEPSTKAETETVVLAPYQVALDMNNSFSSDFNASIKGEVVVDLKKGVEPPVRHSPKVAFSKIYGTAHQLFDESEQQGGVSYTDCDLGNDVNEAGGNPIEEQGTLNKVSSAADDLNANVRCGEGAKPALVGKENASDCRGNGNIASMVFHDCARQPPVSWAYCR